MSYNNLREIELNIVIPTYARDELVKKCVDHLDKVFDPKLKEDLYVRGQLKNNIETTITIYRQVGDDSPEINFNVSNVRIRLVNRPKYIGFVFGQLLYDMAHDVLSPFSIYNRDDGSKYDFTMLLDDDAHYYEYEKSLLAFDNAIEIAITEHISVVFMNEAESKIKRNHEISRFPYQGMGSLFNMTYFDPKKIFSTEFTRIECSVDYLISIKTWVLREKVMVYGLHKFLTKDNNQVGGFQQSISEKLGKPIKNNHGRYEAIHSLKCSAQHIYPDFFHYQSMGNNKPDVRKDVLKYIETNNIHLDDENNISRKIQLMPYDKSHNRFFEMGDYSELTPEGKYQKISEEVIQYINDFNKKYNTSYEVVS